ncbi:MAG: hydrogenase maturation protease [Acidobacteria bacterium]|jgi:hydrogenase maturation protease|nr:hydrogenase maturation protease [Acidobacteriota bacterium]
MSEPSILIAGIGNIFLGDDAFGSEVARRLLLTRKLPKQVRVVDYGIRGLDLAYALLDGYDVTIFVDATPRGGEIGTLYTIEPDLSELDNLNAQEMQVEPHGMNPMKVLAMVKSMGGEFKRILLVGCEPELLAADEEKMGLSEPVALAIDEAVSLIELLVAKILEESQQSATA